MKITWKDSLSPKERMQAFAAGKPIDRIPCMPLVTDQAYALAGGPMSQYYHSAQRMAAAQLLAFETYEADSVGSGPGLFGLAEAMGTKLQFPDNGIPYVIQPAISSYDELDRLTSFDPEKSGRLPLILEALAIVQAEVKDRASVGCSVGGPITTAGAIRGTDNFLKDLRRCPEKVHQLLRAVTDNALKLIDTLSARGIKPSIADPTSSGTMISEQAFREFAKPYLREYSDRIRAHWGGGPFVHICGDTSKVWHDIVDAGASVLSLDNQIDLAYAKEQVGHRICLAGNVKPYTLWKGTPDEVSAEVKECLVKAYDNPKGFILSSGCGLALGTPTDNVLAMMDAARHFGRWPISRDNLLQ